MQDELATHQTTIAAKQKGFSLRNGPLYLPNGNLATKDTWPSYGQLYRNSDPLKFLYAPTQATLARWLRETHDVHIIIERESLDSDEMCYVYEVTHLPETHGKHWVNDLVRKQSFHGAGNTYGGGWYTYEEAMEAALVYALKLLK